MRIIGEYEKESIKITVFKMDGKISVKLESNLMEQTYKFRDGSGIEKLEDVKEWTNEGFIFGVKEIFAQMGKLKIENIEKRMAKKLDSFDEII